MGSARKYILECNTSTPSGMSYVYITKQISLLDSFSGVTDVGTGTTYSYSGITMSELCDLTDEEYIGRVEDFLSYVGRGRLSAATRETLLSNSYAILEIENLIYSP